jgi:hypothetical protein
MTEPYTREELAEFRAQAERVRKHPFQELVSLDYDDLLRLIAMAERLLQVEPVVEAAVAWRESDEEEPIGSAVPSAKLRAVAFAVDDYRKGERR